MTSPSVHVGQRVRVPWGLDGVEGTVVAVFGPKGCRYARVAVELGDPDDVDETPVIALPVDSLEAAAAV
jgi:hypothetical protein